MDYSPYRICFICVCVIVYSCPMSICGSRHMNFELCDYTKLPRSMGTILLSLVAVTGFHLIAANELYIDQKLNVVSEDAGAVTFCVVSGPTLEENLRTLIRIFNLSQEFGNARTAQAGVDYNFLEHNFTASPAYIFTLSPGKIHCFEIDIIDNSVADVNYKVVAFNVCGESCDQAFIFIEDDEGLRFELLQSGLIVSEDVGTVELCVSYSGENVPLSINGTVLPSLVEGADPFKEQDIIFAEVNFTLSVGDRACFDVIIVDDNEVEQKENYRFDLYQLDKNGVNSEYYHDFTHISVADNDAFRFGFERSSYSVLESDGEVVVCVLADRGNGSEIFTATASIENITTGGAIINNRILQQNVILSADLGKQCFNISFTDDKLAEEDKSFQVTLENIESTLFPHSPYQVHTQEAIITIFDDDGRSLLLKCAASDSGGHVIIDCLTNRPPSVVLCSFDGGPNHPCHYPIEINSNVSPQGSYSLSIFIEDDEGFTAESTVHYSITDLVSTVPAKVPPLFVWIVNNSPRVSGNSSEIDFVVSRPTQSLLCSLKKTQTSAVSFQENCSSGRVDYSGLDPATYVFKVTATNQGEDEYIKARAFEITNDATRCTAHFINNGVTVLANSSVLVEFVGQGPILGYQCKVDKNEFHECSSPLVVSGLDTGDHQIKIVPFGRCGRNKRKLNADFNIP